MSRKKRIGLLFGGVSPEHEIYSDAAQRIYHSFSQHHHIQLIKIKRTGHWVEIDGFDTARERPFNLSTAKVDVVFLSTMDLVQPALDAFHIPYTASDPFASMTCLDKDLCKRYLSSIGMTSTPYLVFQKGEPINFDKILTHLKLPWFVKPARQGSSLGVSKVRAMSQLQSATELAFSYNDKILIEQGVEHIAEVCCGVLGNKSPKVASALGILPDIPDFLDFDLKYSNDPRGTSQIPANLATETVNAIRTQSLQIFETLQCKGMARMDYFLKADGSFLLNEVNHMPCLGPHSTYPRLWSASGVTYPQLLEQLIQYAIQKKINHYENSTFIDNPTIGHMSQLGR